MNKNIFESTGIQNPIQSIAHLCIRLFNTFRTSEHSTKTD